MKQLENSKDLFDRHCSNCKYYTCIQSRFMYCTKLQHRIYASRKMDVKISNNITILIMGKRKIKQGQVLITFKDGKKIEYVMISKLVDEKIACFNISGQEYRLIDREEILQNLQDDVWYIANPKEL